MPQLQVNNKLLFDWGTSLLVGHGKVVNLYPSWFFFTFNYVLQICLHMQNKKWFFFQSLPLWKICHRIKYCACLLKVPWVQWGLLWNVSRVRHWIISAQNKASIVTRKEGIRVLLWKTERDLDKRCYQHARHGHEKSEAAAPFFCLPQINISFPLTLFLWCLCSQPTEIQRMRKTSSSRIFSGRLLGMWVYNFSLNVLDQT